MAGPDGDTSCETEDAAEAAGLSYVSEGEPGIARHRQGKGFRYVRHDGRKVADAPTLKRIRTLAIPPAWTEVWICARANGHIQSTGRDAKGRKQYRYHSDFRDLRESAKYEHIMTFARLLPTLRGQVAEHMAMRGLGREKVLATVVHLLESTLIRIGNDDYAKQNQSYGLTTLRDRHVAINGSELRFQFKGKSGKTWRLGLKDRRVANVVRACQDLPGQDLFQYLDSDEVQHSVSSSDVNAYLRNITGQNITAKDFRTWAGTLLAALALQEFEAFDSEAGAKRNVKAAIERVAKRLGNTPTICRKCYVHPEVLSTYIEGSLLLNIKEEAEDELRQNLAQLRPEEAAVVSLLEARLRKISRSDGLRDVDRRDAVASPKVRRSSTKHRRRKARPNGDNVLPS
ncbi:DNA topoisomerase IB [Reyranella sp.]|uniref:DNA topoisomerase IB n=1 Tax=Reyranella sp. TaxID=1929291 RepID=UPI00120E7773|nr:DNA topoisomerase IB [Reyranella sp.]TAJ83078.1 MAG: DNA topoisomerase IB [Reyranella sp.]